MPSCGCIRNSPKKTIVRFLNRKHAKKALTTRKNLRNNSSPNFKIFTNESLTVKNNEITFPKRKLKLSDHVDKIYTKYGTVHITSPEIHREKL